MRFNLCETRHYVCRNDKVHLLEDVYFSGLQNYFMNAHLKLSGKVDILGICFEPDGFYPFLKIPASEFKNQVLGADEIGFRIAKTINERLKIAPGTAARLIILENELLKLLDHTHHIPENFRQIFKKLKQNDNLLQLTEFCQQNTISLRQLERMYIKYVGLSASTYSTLNRFHNSLNQLLTNGYSKLSDLAYDNDYYDQMHFIKEFKRFAGNTPKVFVNQNNSILQIGRLT